MVSRIVGRSCSINVIDEGIGIDANERGGGGTCPRFRPHAARFGRLKDTPGTRHGHGLALFCQAVSEATQRQGSRCPRCREPKDVLHPELRLPSRRREDADTGRMITARARPAENGRGVRAGRQRIAAASGADLKVPRETSRRSRHAGSSVDESREVAAAASSKLTKVVNAKRDDGPPAELWTDGGGDIDGRAEGWSNSDRPARCWHRGCGLLR